LVANSTKPSIAKKVPTPIEDTWALPDLSGARRATSLPAGSTRISVPAFSLNALPTATVMLKPEVPVS
jgi:hypothetical protein